MVLTIDYVKQLPKTLHNNNLTVTKVDKGKTIVITGKDIKPKSGNISLYNYTKTQQMGTKKCQHFINVHY
jgi:hypothetical protein